MPVIRFTTGQLLTLSATTRCFLDTSFIVDGIANDQQCEEALRALQGCQLVVDGLICTETIHILAKAFFKSDLKKLILGSRHYSKSATALRKAMRSQLSAAVDQNGFTFSHLWTECEKRRDASMRALHLVSALKTGCCYLVTTDQDFRRVTIEPPLTVLLVA